MRFRFCWDIDCPDWLLAEIATLSKMTSIKLRLLCAQVAKSVTGEPLNFSSITKLTADAKLDESAARAIVAAIRWILESATGSGTDSGILDSELQQLGLPREHAAAIAKVYVESQEKMASALRDKALLKDTTQWQCKVKGIPFQEKLEPVVELSFETHSSQTTPSSQSLTESSEEEAHEPATKVYMTSSQLDSLIHELTEAQQIMQDLK